jgi:hypothetical protein
VSFKVRIDGHAHAAATLGGSIDQRIQVGRFHRFGRFGPGEVHELVDDRVDVRDVAFQIAPRGLVHRQHFHAQPQTREWRA